MTDDRLPAPRAIVEAESRLARPLLEHEEPAGGSSVAPVAGLPPRASSAVEVEAEEIDVGIDLGLVERASAPSRAAGPPSRRRRGRTSSRSWLGSMWPFFVAHFARVGVDDRGRVFLQELAADREDDLIALLARVGLAVVVLAQLRAARPGVDRRDVVELLAQRRRRRAAVGSKWHGDVPELTEIGAALVGRVFAPQEFAREFVVDADHIGFDEVLVRLERHDAVALDQVEVGDEALVAQLLQRPVHRQVDARVVFDLVEHLDDLARGCAGR